MPSVAPIFKNAQLLALRREGCVLLDAFKFPSNHWGWAGRQSASVLRLKVGGVWWAVEG